MHKVRLVIPFSTRRVSLLSLHFTTQPMYTQRVGLYVVFVEILYDAF